MVRTAKLSKERLNGRFYPSKQNSGVQSPFLQKGMQHIDMQVEAGEGTSVPFIRPMSTWRIATN